MNVVLTWILCQSWTGALRFLTCLTVSPNGSHTAQPTEASVELGAGILLRTAKPAFLIRRKKFFVYFESSYGMVTWLGCT